VALYAGVLGKPVILAGLASTTTVPGSAAEVLAGHAPLWDPNRASREQIDAVADRPDDAIVDAVTELLVEPLIDGAECARRLRAVMYRLLRLEEPATLAAFGPVLAMPTGASPAAAWVAGAVPQPDGVRIERYPDLGWGDPHTDLEYRHVVADLRTASIAQLGAAAILVTHRDPAESIRDWGERASAELARWPQAMMLAAVVDGISCAVRTTAGMTLVLRADAPIDPTVLASLAYARLVSTGYVPPSVRLYLGDRAIAVAAGAG
jgi:hypothetical protein